MTCYPDCGNPTTVVTHPVPSTPALADTGSSSLDLAVGGAGAALLGVVLLIATAKLRLGRKA